MLESDSNCGSSSTISLDPLNKYTTNEKLSIVTNFLNGGETIKSQTTMAEKVKHRLEQLDEFEEGTIRQMLDLSQQEYVIKIEQLNHELVQAWNTDQRAKALKIAVRGRYVGHSILSVEIRPDNGHPGHFRKVGVYERLLVKSGESMKPVSSRGSAALPDNFTPDMVPESAK